MRLPQPMAGVAGPLPGGRSAGSGAACSLREYPTPRGPCVWVLMWGCIVAMGGDIGALMGREFRSLLSRSWGTGYARFDITQERGRARRATAVVCRPS